jgi:beta-glucanase (GH16 family)
MFINIRKLLIFCSLGCFIFLSSKSTGPRLVWSDDFNVNGTPDSSKWSYDLGVGNPEGWGNNELQFYTRDPRNARVENGFLIIEARKDSMGHKAFTSARMVSRKKGDWRYGRIEVKAKLPKGKGTWPAIWMLSTDWKYGGWPASGEIDIMEHVGFDQGVVHGTIHTELYNHSKGTQKEGKITIADASEAFHIYGLEWTDAKMDFMVDRKIYHTVVRDPNDDFKGWPFDQPFHLILNIAVGGNWGGREGVDENIWPQRMEVDFVKVYQ